MTKGPRGCAVAHALFACSVHTRVNAFSLLSQSLKPLRTAARRAAVQNIVVPGAELEYSRGGKLVLQWMMHNTQMTQNRDRCDSRAMGRSSRRAFLAPAAGSAAPGFAQRNAAPP